MCIYFYTVYVGTFVQVFTTTAEKISIVCWYSMNIQCMSLSRFKFYCLVKLTQFSGVISQLCYNNNSNNNNDMVMMLACKEH